MFRIWKNLRQGQFVNFNTFLSLQVIVLKTLTIIEKSVKNEKFFDDMIRNIDFVGSIVQSLIMGMTSLKTTSDALASATNAAESGTYLLF